jgi:hypothetical protein
MRLKQKKNPLEALKSKQIDIKKLRTNFKTNIIWRTHLNF